MDYIEQYKRGRDKLLKRIEAFLAKTGGGQTYFGVKACGYQGAVQSLRKGHAKLQTVEALQKHIDKVDPEGAD